MSPAGQPEPAVLQQLLQGVLSAFDVDGSSSSMLPHVLQNLKAQAWRQLLQLLQRELGHWQAFAAMFKGAAADGGTCLRDEFRGMSAAAVEQVLGSSMSDAAGETKASSLESKLAVGPWQGWCCALYCWLLVLIMVQSY